MSNDPFFGICLVPDIQRSFTGPFPGGLQNIGSALTVNPIIIIFDNQMNIAVDLYINNVLWKTFSIGEAIVLDLRANHGDAPSCTFNIGDAFECNGTAGTGSFLISILYARS